MERFSTSSLRYKDIINLCDGTNLGNPDDFEFNSCDGRITALIVEGKKGIFGIGSTNDIIIPWCKIECIGDDAILVRLKKEDFQYCACDQKNGKKSPWKM